MPHQKGFNEKCLPPSNPVMMNAATRPVSPTLYTTRRIIPIRTGILVNTDGIQKLRSRSAAIPAASAATTDSAVAIVGNVLIREMEYISGFSLRYRLKGVE